MNDHKVIVADADNLNPHQFEYDFLRILLVRIIELCTQKDFQVDPTLHTLANTQVSVEEMPWWERGLVSAIFAIIYISCIVVLLLQTIGSIIYWWFLLWRAWLSWRPNLIRNCAIFGLVLVTVVGMSLNA